MRKECKPQGSVIVPLSNGKAQIMSKEQYDSLNKFKENYLSAYRSKNVFSKENFYVDRSDYQPPVQTEDEYTPMLSLYRPKEVTKVVTPEPVIAPTPVPVPIPASIVDIAATGATGPSTKEGFVANRFLDHVSLNFPTAHYDEVVDGYSKTSPFLMKNGPFFLRNGELLG
jgi:hypothetical protein